MRFGRFIADFYLGIKVPFGVGATDPVQLMGDTFAIPKFSLAAYNQSIARLIFSEDVQGYHRIQLQPLSLTDGVVSQTFVLAE